MRILRDLEEFDWEVAGIVLKLYLRRTVKKCLPSHINC